MRTKNWLRDALEETMYKHFVSEQPALVSNIKALLQSGETKSKIKKFIQQKAGSNATNLHLGHLIDYIHKQVNN
jgi:hypothetical protein